jgi:hypothetical protein
MRKARSTLLLVNCFLLGPSAAALAEQAKPAPAAPVAPAPAAAPAAAATTKSHSAPAAAPVVTAPAAVPTSAAPAKAAAVVTTTAPNTKPVAAAPVLAGGAPVVAAPPPAAAPPAPAPVVVVPKPAPELDQMKVLEGKWRCDGRAPAGPSGPEHAYKSTWKFKRDLDNFWWAAEYQQTKAKAHPMPLKARGYMTWDPSAKAFVLVGVDNMGGSSTETTTGWSGDVVTLAGDASMAGKKVPYREVITKKGNREFTWRGEMKTGGDWVTLGEDRCRK